MPQVSVIIPVYNGQPYIIEALQSVFSQTFSDQEVVVVDDGSTDDTPDVIATFGRDHPVRYVWQPNQERAVARNTGVACAKGKYIAFLDQDDRWLPTKLERQLAALEMHSSQAGIVYSRAYYIDESGKRLPHSYYKKLYSGQIAKQLILGNFIRPSSVLVRRECLEHLGGFAMDMVPADDWDLWLRLSSVYEFLLVEEPLVEYRIHSGQTCQNVDVLADAIQRVLIKVFSDPLTSPYITSLRRQSYSRAYLDIALSYYHISQTHRSHAYLRKALVAYPLLLTNRQFWSVLARSFLGSRLKVVRQALGRRYE